jgi:hypothetical protein
MDRGMPNAKLAGVMHFGLDDAPLTAWSIQHLLVRLLEWKGPPSTIVKLRLPLELLARLERSIDRLESHTGLKAHRGMIARRALELFLETHEPG